MMWLRVDIVGALAGWWAAWC